MLETYSYYGVPVFYRIENRQVGKSLVLSLRVNEEGKLADPCDRIVYEDGPLLIDKELSKGKTIDEIIGKRIPAFWERAFPIDKGDLTGLDRGCYDLPLAVIWDIDKKKMKKDQNWGDSTKKEYDRSFEWILERWGHLPLREVVPALCAPQLLEETESKHERIARAMRQLFYCEAELGFVTENPWESPVQGRRRQQNQDHLGQVYIADYVLPRSCCRQIVSRCFAGLTRKADGGLYFGVLLCMVVALSLDEIAALTFDCFRYLVHYPMQMVIDIRQHLVRRGNNWSIQKLDQPARIRQVAVPSLIKKALETYKNTVSGQGNEYVLRSPKNAARRITPDMFKKWVDENFGDIVKEYVMLGPIPSNKGVYEILHQTALAQPDICGYEEEEARYVRGKKPKATHAKHYCDFANEAELNKMGALLDWRATGAWIAHVANEENSGQKVLSKNGGFCEWKPAPESRGEVDLVVEIPGIDFEDIPDSGLQLEVAIPHGGQIRIKYEEAA